MIRKGKLKDIYEIMEIVSETISVMKEEGIDQWDDSHPLQKDFEKDLHNNSLYVIEHNEIIGSITIDENQPEEYETLNWSENEHAYVFHRLVVKPAIRKLGVASELIDFAVKQTLQNNITYMRIDTYSLNEKVLQLFLKKGYKRIGEMSFHGKQFPFYCFDRKLVD